MVEGEPQMGETATAADASAAARKRAAIELVARHGPTLKRTARRYSICEEDAEDAYQRSLEILLTKAPDIRAHELIRWMQTVVKHESLAVRAYRERMLGPTPRRREEGPEEDWVNLIPATGDSLDDRLERRERVARSREALQRLKPAELRALTLLAEGYTYAEIGEMTGFSQTKINRCLAEGRERFRELVSRSEDGRRCEEMGPLLSAFCDDELDPEQAVAVREHLRACAVCRATMRSYRAAPGAAAALFPALPASSSLLEKTQEFVAAIQARLATIGAGSGDSAVAQVASSGGTRGVGMAALAKALTICAGTAGGAAACVAAGIAPAPADLFTGVPERPAIERQVAPAAEPGPTPPEPERIPPPAVEEPSAEDSPETSATRAPASEPSTTGAVEYVPPPPPAPAPATASGSSEAGSAAGEFGP